MLALSTFRRSEEAVSTAIQNAKSAKKLFLIYVVDVNLARYFIGTENKVGSDLKETREADLLELHEQGGKDHVDGIAARARKEGIEIESSIQVGRFAPVCLDMVREKKPSLIVTTRSRRPEWVKKVFGAPVIDLIEKAGCPVLVV